MRFLSLFAGIGGFDLGLERAGWKCVGQVEIDPYCRAVLAKHWPDVPRMEDVRDVQGNEFGPVDAVVGGFPCQPHSVAGKRLGKADERHLWPEYARIIRSIRPRWVVAENVPGLRTTAADEVVGDLEEAGYAVWPSVVGAIHVGAGFVGQRVWIMATPRCEGLEAGRQVPIRPVRVLTMSAGRGVHRRVAGRKQRQHEWEEPRLVERPMGVSVDGVPTRLVRLASANSIKALGNSIVPQVAEAVGRAINAVDGSMA